LLILTHIIIIQKKDRFSHIGPEEYINYIMTIGIENEPNMPEVRTNAIRKPLSLEKYRDKNLRQYLNELKRACQQDTNEILLKRTNNDTINNKEKHLKPVPVVKTASNIEAYTFWFNRLSMLVTSEVVRTLKMDKRVDVINFLIETVYACFELGNYNSAMAIIGNFKSYIYIFVFSF
jgi:hypothetical protein